MIDTSTVWDQHADALRGFLASRVAQDDVDDLLQEAFVRIHAKLEGLRDDERLTAWVYQISRNLITDHYRKRGTLPAEADVAEVYAKVDEPVREYLIACVEPFISQLPETYRDAVRMSELEGMTQVEVAERPRDCEADARRLLPFSSGCGRAHIGFRTERPDATRAVG